MESFSSVGRRPKLAGSVETTKSQWKMEQRCLEFGVAGQGIREERWESLKREQEVLVLAEELKAQGSVDDNTRAVITRGLKRLRKIRVEEEETLR